MKKFGLPVYKDLRFRVDSYIQQLSQELSAGDEYIVRLDVCSLILVHGQPLSIRFRMEEKKFGVDGAYNVRYEIIKKRIDKAVIRETGERLTQPGKIAIIYSDEREAKG